MLLLTLQDVYPPWLAAPHSCSQFSSVGIAIQHDCPSLRLLSQDQNEVRQTCFHSMEKETIKMALMTPCLMLSFLCHKNRLFREKQIAGMSCQISTY